MYSDLCNVDQPKISIVTPSLNHGRFLKETIDSITSQSYRKFEHIVIDGGSTDETLDVLRDHPHIRWISESDGGVLEALQKGFSLARGDYIIQCCVSDGFVDRNWFQKCVDILDEDVETTLVWGLPLYLTEESDLLALLYQEFLNDPPPQKQDFLALWLANGFVLPEGNYCARSEVIRKCLPDRQSEGHFQVQLHLGIMYEFMTRGYCPCFVPAIAHFFRAHHDQRSQQLLGIEAPAAREYFRAVREYRRRLLSKETTHSFRNGHSEVIRQVEPTELWSLRQKIWRHRVLRSRLVRLDLYSMALKVKGRIKRWSKA